MIFLNVLLTVSSGRIHLPLRNSETSHPKPDEAVKPIIVDGVVREESGEIVRCINFFFAFESMTKKTYFSQIIPYLLITTISFVN